MDFFTDSFKLCTPTELIKMIEFQEATVLWQVHYWTELNRKAGRNYYDGRYWTYNSMDKWAETFFWWSRSTVKRIFAELEKNGYLLTGNYNKMKIDHTKWYAVNYEKFKESSRLAQNEPNEKTNSTHAIPSLNEETNKKEVRVVTTNHYEEEYSKLVSEYGRQNVERICLLTDSYIDYWYPHYRKQKHKYLGSSKRLRFAEKLLKCIRETDVDIEDVEDALNYCVELSEDNDPTIFYITSSLPLGYWLLQSGVPYEFIMGTEYDCNKNMRGLFRSEEQKTKERISRNASFLEMRSHGDCDNVNLY